MISYEEVQTVTGPFPGSAPFQSVVEFYRTNGYELQEVAASSEDSDRAEHRAILERGEAPGGWWSANTATLPTRVEVEFHGERLDLTYSVDSPGQPLTESDRKFWRREMRAAINQTRNPKRRPTDLRHEAAIRAEHLRRRFLSYGIWVVIALLVFVVVVNFFTDGWGA